MSKKSLTIFANSADDGGCGNYRIIQPIKTLTKRGHVAFIPGKGVENEKLIEASRNADVVVLQRPTSKGALDFYELNRKDPSQLSVFEHDDNPWDVHPMNDSYRHHGTEEIKLTAKQLKENGYYDELKDSLDSQGEYWIWKDGKAGFDIARNIRTTKYFNSCIAAADLVTTTTEILADEFRKRLKEFGNPDPQVETLPNCLNLEHWEPVEIVKPKDEIRLLWQGGASHFDDWATIAEPITEVLKKYPNVKLIMMGTHFPGATKHMNPEQVETHDSWTTFDAHPYRMKLTGADIGLIPLQDSFFNRCKSNIKYVEYSALKIPTVAAGIPPYSPSIEHGKTGFLANTKAEWVEQVSALVEDAALRKTTGEAARRWVEKNHDASKQAILWERVYLKHLKKKKTNK